MLGYLYHLRLTLRTDRCLSIRPPDGYLPKDQLIYTAVVLHAWWAIMSSWTSQLAPTTAFHTTNLQLAGDLTACHTFPAQKMPQLIQKTS